MNKSTRRAGRAFFEPNAAVLAPRLIGQRLVRILDGVRLGGVIVEAEAYTGVRDAASHAFGGRRSARNASMYAAPGTAYVYFTYGMHHCFNVVCGEEGDPQAVLIRALEVREGGGVMRGRRTGAGGRDDRICRGPGCLCLAMGIDRALDGEDLVRSDRVWIEVERERSYPKRMLGRGARVGIGARAGEWVASPLRWWLIGSGAVSRS